MIHKIHNYFYNDELDIRRRLYTLSGFMTLFILMVLAAEVLIFTRSIEQFAPIFGIMVIHALIGVTTLRTRRIKTGAVLSNILMCFVFYPFVFIQGGGVEGSGPIWFIFNIFMINMVLDGVLRSVFSVLEILLTIAGYVISFFLPDLITPVSGAMFYIIDITTLILVATDVAIVISMENRLNMLQMEKMKEQGEEIQGLVASQNKFFSSMSHEIRTPINTIIGLNEMILRENISDEIAENAINIRSAGKMLLNTINDILDMSKFQSGDMTLLEEEYETGSMLSDIVGMMWLRSKEKNLDFTIDVSPDVPAKLKGDEVRIKQILTNILNNAIKYTKEGYVKLFVECEKKEDRTVTMIYTVKDSGMGIKKEDIPYLFTAFKRVDESNTKHIEGTGLGLSIVKQFVDLMGGTVTVNSVYTKGSAFVVEIPQKMVSDEEIGEYNYEKRHKLEKRPEYKKHFEAPDAKLLVVDDNDSNLLVVTKLLRDTKMQIDTAKNGQEALERTLEKPYDLIFMDHLMPEMDGIEAFHAIRNQVGGRNRETNIVILTANAGAENRKLYATAGFNGYLVKPVTGEDLEAEVYRQIPRNLIKVLDDTGMESSETISWLNETRKKRRIVITTESTCDLPKKLIDKYNIVVFAYKVKTDEGIFRDGIEIDTPGLLRYMEDATKAVNPVPPSVEEYENFFAGVLANANNVIHLSLSSEFETGSFRIAKEAAGAFDRVTIVDSRHMSCSQGMMAIMAARMAEAGMGVGEIVPALETRLYSRIHASFMLDNLSYLARSGQISKGYARFMNALMLHPISIMKKGKIVSKSVLMGSRERVWKKYIKKSLSGFKADHTVLFVNHVGLTKKEMEWIRAEIEKKEKFNAIYFEQTSPVVAISCGPGSFGISVVEKV